MTITSEEIQKLASLSRLKVTEEDAERYANEISHVLKYVDQIQEVTEGADTTTAEVKNPADIMHRNVMRDDVADQALCKDSQKLVEAAPDHLDGLIKVKKILG